jgi:hypothetical protein
LVIVVLGADVGLSVVLGAITLTIVSITLSITCWIGLVEVVALITISPPDTAPVELVDDAVELELVEVLELLLELLEEDSVELELEDSTLLDDSTELELLDDSVLDDDSTELLDSTDDSEDTSLEELDDSTLDSELIDDSDELDDVSADCADTDVGVATATNRMKARVRFLNIYIVLYGL